MPVVAWVVFGVGCGIVLTRASTHLFKAVAQSSERLSSGYSRWWYIVASVVGGTTALITSWTGSLMNATMLWVTMALALVQSPLDAHSRRLSRPVTLLALSAVGLLLVVWALQSKSVVTVGVAAGIALLVGSGYALINHLSPRSIGFGDVLLVLPLSLAIASVDFRAVTAWQLVASSSAAIHGLLTRVSRHSSFIPFGPHLLGAAWLVLVFSV